eukprot:NODE_556_length_6708_cov_0.674837.p7 type:complete len:104 gc:universal NODE_556_length_6708_cov_0.674837:248-559(+)
MVIQQEPCQKGIENISPRQFRDSAVFECRQDFQVKELWCTCSKNRKKTKKQDSISRSFKRQYFETKTWYQHRQKKYTSQPKKLGFLVFPVLFLLILNLKRLLI